MKRQMLFALAVLTLCSLGVASAQTYPYGAYFTVDYFSNNTAGGAPDGTVRINNPGSSTSTGTSAAGKIIAFSTTTAPIVGDSSGDLCAMIYVFDNDQEMNECCGCITTPDGLRTLSIKNDLTSNPLTVPVNTGDIKIIGAFPNSSAPCDPTAGFLVPLYAGFNDWATHIQNKVGSSFPITETGFTQSAISIGEGDSLIADCYFTQRLGSGRGVCSCGTGD
jgi:hypothetical protein